MTPWTTACQASLSFTICWSLLKLISIDSMIPIQPSHPLSAPSFFCPQSSPTSGSFPKSQLFPSGSQSIGASASAAASKEYSGLISFRTDWFDLLAVQGTLKSLLQHHSSKASSLFPDLVAVPPLSPPTSPSHCSLPCCGFFYLSRL